MNSEHMYAGLEDNKMHELYYKRETGSGNNKFHDLECPDVGDMTGVTEVTGLGPDGI